MALKLNEFDPARYLDDDEAICDYLEAILEEERQEDEGKGKSEKKKIERERERKRGEGRED